MSKYYLYFILMIFSSSCRDEEKVELQSDKLHLKSEVKMEMIHNYWKQFQKQNPEYANNTQPPSFYFGDNKEVADECAELVVQGIKKATSPSLWWYEKNNEKLPQPGDLAIVTDWDGEPKAIIKTTRIQIVKFKNITSEYAFIEGEGDKSLDYWKKEHWKYYTNEMSAFGESPTVNMEIVCEHFETIW